MSTGAAPEPGEEPHSWPAQLPRRLAAHLDRRVGDPTTGRLAGAALVVANPVLDRPGWDGTVRSLRATIDPDGRIVIGVAPRLAEALAAGLAELPEASAVEVAAALPALVGQPEGRVYRGLMRWATTPVDLPDAGVWLEHTDPRVPAWLHPFGGQALVALDGERHLAGVGIKRHDEHGWELAVVTDETARGRGLARRLVAQAARHVLDAERVPVYLHGPDNLASARVADAAGFGWQGWWVMGLATS